MPASSPTFPTYLQMRERVPIGVWWALRGAGLVVVTVVIVTLFVDARTGFAVFWGIVVPLLPILFFVAPGFWRNVCPMATLNQLPRVLGFTRALTMPKWFREYGYVIGIGLFLVIVPARKLVFEQNGAALGVLLIASLVTPFVAGILLKGKSGWCSTMCPLLPVQRLYGQTPFLTVRNAHCRPCVGCVKNCYDFNPPVAYIADVYDSDPHRSGYRRFFAGVFPGLVVAFHEVPVAPEADALSMYAQFGTYLAVSLGIFYALEVFLKVTVVRVTSLFALAGLNLYYLYTLPAAVERIEAATGVAIPDAAAWAITTALLAASAVWAWRTLRNEGIYVAQTLAKPARVEPSAVPHLRKLHAPAAQTAPAAAPVPTQTPTG
jgi:hypothetical protein